MRLLHAARVALVLVASCAASLVAPRRAFAEPVTIDPIRIALRPARPRVTEVAAPAKSLLATDPRPSLAPRITEPIGRDPF